MAYFKSLSNLLESGSCIPVYVGGTVYNSNYTQYNENDYYKCKGLVDIVGYSSYYRGEVFSVYTNIQNKRITVKLIELSNWKFGNGVNFLVPKYIPYKYLYGDGFGFESSLYLDRYSVFLHEEMKSSEEYFDLYGYLYTNNNHNSIFGVRFKQYFLKKSALLFESIENKLNLFVSSKWHALKLLVLSRLHCNNGIDYINTFSYVYFDRFSLNKFIYNWRRIYFNTSKVKFIFNYDFFFKKKIIIKNKFNFTSIKINSSSIINEFIQRKSIKINITKCIYIVNIVALMKFSLKNNSFFFFHIKLLLLFLIEHIVTIFSNYNLVRLNEFNVNDFDKIFKVSYYFSFLKNGCVTYIYKNVVKVFFLSLRTSCFAVKYLLINYILHILNNIFLIFEKKEKLLSIDYFLFFQKLKKYSNFYKLERFRSEFSLTHFLEKKFFLKNVLNWNLFLPTFICDNSGEIEDDDNSNELSSYKLNVGNKNNIKDNYAISEKSVYRDIMYNYSNNVSQIPLSLSLDYCTGKNKFQLCFLTFWSFNFFGLICLDRYFIDSNKNVFSKMVYFVFFLKKFLNYCNFVFTQKVFLSSFRVINYDKKTALIIYYNILLCVIQMLHIYRVMVHDSFNRYIILNKRLIKNYFITLNEHYLNIAVSVKHLLGDMVDDNYINNYKKTVILNNNNLSIVPGYNIYEDFIKIFNIDLRKRKWSRYSKFFLKNIIESSNKFYCINVDKRFVFCNLLVGKSIKSYTCFLSSLYNELKKQVYGYRCNRGDNFIYEKKNVVSTELKFIGDLKGSNFFKKVKFFCHFNRFLIGFDSDCKLNNFNKLTYINCIFLLRNYGSSRFLNFNFGDVVKLSCNYKLMDFNIRKKKFFLIQKGRLSGLLKLLLFLNNFCLDKYIKWVIKVIKDDVFLKLDTLFYIRIIYGFFFCSKCVGWVDSKICTNNFLFLKETKNYWYKFYYFVRFSTKKNYWNNGVDTFLLNIDKSQVRVFSRVRYKSIFTSIMLTGITCLYKYNYISVIFSFLMNYIYNYIMYKNTYVMYIYMLYKLLYNENKFIFNKELLSYKESLIKNKLLHFNNVFLREKIVDYFIFLKKDNFLKYVNNFFFFKKLSFLRNIKYVNNSLNSVKNIDDGVRFGNKNNIHSSNNCNWKSKVKFSNLIFNKCFLNRKVVGNEYSLVAYNAYMCYAHKCSLLSTYCLNDNSSIFKSGIKSCQLRLLFRYVRIYFLSERLYMYYVIMYMISKVKNKCINKALLSKVKFYQRGVFLNKRKVFLWCKLFFKKAYIREILFFSKWFKKLSFLKLNFLNHFEKLITKLKTINFTLKSKNVGLSFNLKYRWLYKRYMIGIRRYTFFLKKRKRRKKYEREEFFLYKNTTKVKLIYVLNFSKYFFFNVNNYQLAAYDKEFRFTTYLLSNMYSVFRRLGYNTEYFYFDSLKFFFKKKYLCKSYLRRLNYYRCNKLYSSDMFFRKVNYLFGCKRDLLTKCRVNRTSSKYVVIQNRITKTDNMLVKYNYIKNEISLRFLVKRIKFLFKRYLYFLLAVFFKFLRKKYRFMKKKFMRKYFKIVFRKRGVTKKAALEFLIKLYISVIIRGILLLKRIMSIKYIFIFKGINNFSIEKLMFKLICCGKKFPSFFSNFLNLFFDIKYIIYIYRYKLVSYLMNRFYSSKTVFFYNFILQTKFKFIYILIKNFFSKLLISSSHFNRNNKLLLSFNADSNNLLFLLKWKAYFFLYKNLYVNLSFFGDYCNSYVSSYLNNVDSYFFNVDDYNSVVDMYVYRQFQYVNINYIYHTMYGVDNNLFSYFFEKLNSIKEIFFVSSFPSKSFSVYNSVKVYNKLDEKIWVWNYFLIKHHNEFLVNPHNNADYFVTQTNLSDEFTKNKRMLKARGVSRIN